MTDIAVSNHDGFNPWRFALYVCIAVVAGLFILPTVGITLAAFKPGDEIAAGDLWSLPNSLYLGNFTDVLANPWVKGYFVNTFLVAIPASLASIFLGFLAGWVFAKLPFKGSEAVFMLLISGIFFPPQVILIPLFKMFDRMGMIDTLWPMIIVHTALGIPICTLLMRNFFSAVPNALREAALVEGVSEWQVLTRIALPLSLPAVAVLATLQFTWIWNDFLWPLIFTQSEDVRTVMLGIVFLRGEYEVAWGAQGALALLSSLPTLVVFLFFQRYFIQGLTMGAVKG